MESLVLTRGTKTDEERSGDGLHIFDCGQVKVLMVFTRVVDNAWMRCFVCHLFTRYNVFALLFYNHLLRRRAPFLLDK